MESPNKKNIVLSFFTLFFIITIVSSILIAFKPGDSLSSILYNLGKLAGLIGFICLGFIIFLGDTGRFFDRFLGLDRIITFNKKFGIATTLFVLLHPLFFILSLGKIFNFLVPNFSRLPLALGILAFYFLIIISIASLIYKRISYNLWQYLHILIYILFFFSLYHAVKIGSDSGNIMIKIIYYSILIAVLVGLIYRIKYKLQQRKNKFTVEKIKWETKDTFTLSLKPNKPFNFKAGQWCFLRLNKNKLYARHPFTISSSPNDKALDFTIKLEGKFTKIASKLKKGEEVLVEGPFGVFTIEEGDCNLIFIAGGVGVTPFISIIKDQLNKKKKRNINLIYGSRKYSEIIFKKQIDKLKGNWIKKTYVISDDKKTNKICERGFINKDILTKCVKQPCCHKFYMCGPVPMKDCVKKALKSLKVKKKNIFIENFFW